MLPDFKLELSSTAGEPTERLAELKMIGAVSKWYPRSGGLARKKKGVERRSVPLQGEYRTPLTKLDSKYHGTPHGQQGPLVRRLESYGNLLCLVVGNFQEGSKDIHYLLEQIAESKLRAMGLARGRDGTDHEKSVILMNLRRELSTAAAKANSVCLLGRVSKIGDCHRLAAKRRVWVRREQELRDEANRAHWLANIRGRGVLHCVSHKIHHLSIL